MQFVAKYSIIQITSDSIIMEIMCAVKPNQRWKHNEMKNEKIKYLKQNTRAAAKF